MVVSTAFRTLITGWPTAALLLDLTPATILSTALARRHRLAAAGALGGVLPDLMMVAELRTGLRVTLPLHHANHTSIEPPVVIGVLTQLIAVGALLSRLHSGRWADDVGDQRSGRFQIDREAVQRMIWRAERADDGEKGC
jgi:hypothetical protein